MYEDCEGKKLKNSFQDETIYTRYLGSENQTEKK